MVSFPLQRVKRRSGADNGNGSASAEQPYLAAEALLGQPASQAATLSQGQSHGVTATVQQNLLPGTQRPNDVFMSVNLPIDARVPAKIRSKIIQNEFVDFGSLLVHPAFEDKFHINLQPSQEGSSPSLSLEPLNKTKHITSIDV